MHPAVHQALTRITLDTFRPTLAKAITAHAEAIIGGTKAEDRWWEPSRTKNWHFYRREGSPILEQTRWLRMRPTSEYIFSKRVKEMQSCAMDDPKRYVHLGRILHHIQDMSTPSHVRPVYHGPVLHDHFEAFMVDMLPNIRPLIPSTRESHDDDFMAIYRDAAETTLRFMESCTVSATVNGQAQELPLSVFWEDCTVNEDPKRPGFGRFGKLHKLFKAKNRFEAVVASDDKHYRISPEALHKLNNTLCGKAVADTYRALVCASHSS